MTKVTKIVVPLITAERLEHATIRTVLDLSDNYLFLSSKISAKDIYLLKDEINLINKNAKDRTVLKIRIDDHDHYKLKNLAKVIGVTMTNLVYYIFYLINERGV